MFKQTLFFLLCISIAIVNAKRGLREYIFGYGRFGRDALGVNKDIIGNQNARLERDEMPLIATYGSKTHTPVKHHKHHHQEHVEDSPEPE